MVNSKKIAVILHKILRLFFCYFQTPYGDSSFKLVTTFLLNTRWKSDEFQTPYGDSSSKLTLADAKKKLFFSSFRLLTETVLLNFRYPGFNKKYQKEFQTPYGDSSFKLWQRLD